MSARLLRSIVAATMAALGLGFLPSVARADAPPLVVTTYDQSSYTGFYWHGGWGDRSMSTQFVPTTAGKPWTVSVVGDAPPSSIKVYAGEYAGGQGTVVAQAIPATLQVSGWTAWYYHVYTYHFDQVSAKVLDPTKTYSLVETSNWGVEQPFGGYAPGSWVVSAEYVAHPGLGILGSMTLQTDTTPPTGTVTYSPALPDGNNGWYRTYPTGSFDCTDTGLGVATCPSPATATSDGIYRATGKATDLAANEATITGPKVKVDTAAPVITPHLTPSTPDGTNSWYRTMPIADPNCADSTSGVATCTHYATETSPGHFTEHYAATDVAGNSRTVTTTLLVDDTAPTVSLDGIAPSRQYLVGTLKPRCIATDDVSGVASCVVTYSAAPTEPGRYTATATATDKAGNVDTVAVTFTLVAQYAMTAPASDTALLAGHTYTFTFKATDAQGRGVDVAGTPVHLEPVMCNADGSGGTPSVAGRSMTRVAVGTWQLPVHLEGAMAHSHFWKFGVLFAGKTYTQVYEVR